MATLTGTLVINVVPPAAPPPPQAGTPFLVFNPSPANVEPGKSATVQVLVNDGAGNLTIPTTGVLVPYWGGPNNGVQVFVVAGYKLKIDVPVGTSLVNGLNLAVELR